MKSGQPEAGTSGSRPRAQPFARRKPGKETTSLGPLEESRARKLELCQEGCAVDEYFRGRRRVRRDVSTFDARNDRF